MIIFRRGTYACRKIFGFRDIAGKKPMENDSIYRIYSMTKTFTIVTAMTLYEKGFFKLHDPISEFLPAFKKMKVARHDSRGIWRAENAARPITFEHLFTMTSSIPSPGQDSPSARFLLEVNEKAARDAAAGKPGTTAQVVYGAIDD